MLPNVPPEVFDTFLKPLILNNNIGWPFFSVDFTYGEWTRILSPLSLIDFSKLRWVRNTFTFNDSLFYPGSLADINLIIENKTTDVWALVGRDSTPCRRNLLWHEEFTLKTGRLFAPVTIARTNRGMKLLDGNHRIAALMSLNLHKTIPIDAWIGEL